MNNIKKLLALLLAVAMLATLFAGCDETTDSQNQPGGQVTSTAQGTLVIANGSMDQYFSPFYVSSSADAEVVGMVTGALLEGDRVGDMILNGIEGEKRTYNGKEYTYYTPGNCKVTMNNDGTVDYELKIKNNMKFSDGTPITIDDVIFGLYVVLDPTYDGTTSMVAVPIDGVEAYHAGMESRAKVIRDAGEGGYKDDPRYTKEQYEKFWEYYNGQAIEDFVDAIYDCCVAEGAIEEGASIAECAAAWLYPDLPANATYLDFWNAMLAEYDSPQEAENAESAGEGADRLSLTRDNLGDDFIAGVVVAEGGAPNISGIVRIDDYTMRIHCTKFDANAIYQMMLPIVSKEFYGDPNTPYDYANNQFGFPKGDLRSVKAKTKTPTVTSGPYYFKSFENEIATLEANPYYFKGEPKIKTLKYKYSATSDYLASLISGEADIASPTFSKEIISVIKKANSNGELEGDKLKTVLLDYLGYGYIGINADRVYVGEDPASEESKYMRKAIMTVMAACRDTVIASYYGEFASVIQYPISSTSWASPRPTDENYRVAFSTALDGTNLYTSAMSEEEKYAAAVKAALEYFEAAGYTVKNGKLSSAPNGAMGLTEKTAYEVLIPGDGQQKHPSYGICLKAKELLHSIGFEIKLKDVDSVSWGMQLNSEAGCEIWAGAWDEGIDPDMYQIYHSNNANGGTGSNYYRLRDADLDKIIMDARVSSNNVYRRSAYKKALDLVLDWAVELPVYQRMNPIVFSAERIKLDTLPSDMTPYFGWDSEIEKIEVK